MHVGEPAALGDNEEHDDDDDDDEGLEDKEYDNPKDEVEED
jgi:hypothetical protein